MKIIYKKVSELIPYVNNPRKNDKAVDAVASSIKNYGFRNAILIDAKNEIINGHTRLKAAQKLGMLEVPCVMAEDLTPAQVKGLRIADNKVAEAAEWDYDLLKIELDDIDDFTGFDLDDLNLNDKEIIEDDFNTDEALQNIEQPITKRGDIWKLGNHRLMCGDSTSVDDVENLMDGNKPDAIITDPPYGIGIDGQKQSISKNPKHNRKSHEFRNWDNCRPDKKVFEYILSFNCSTVIWGGNYFADLLPATRGWLYWSKGQDGLSMSDGELAWTTENKVLRSITINRANLHGSVHPTQKPLQIIYFSLDYIDAKKNILDLFGGSGSTLIACEQTDRICYMMELDEKYCDVIIKRWETLTGKKAEKVA